MSTKSPVNSASAIANDLFDQFIAASNLKGVLTTFRKIRHELDLSPGSFNVFYPALKHGLSGGKHKQLKNWKAASIFNKIDKKASNKIYSVSSNSYSTGAGGNNTDTCHAGSFGSGNNNARRSTANTNGQSFAGSSSDNNFACNNVQHDQPASNNILREHNCLIIGGGPCGLRTAIELQLLGASNVVVVEKRDRYSRNNVLHLWPFVIADLKQMAGKKFYGKFCAGSIDHVSIRQLQLMLLKFALILGVDFVENITFEEMCPKSFTASLSTKLPTTDSGQCSCDAAATCMSQQFPSKVDCDESCLHCSSDNVDGNVLSNVCNATNKRRHTGNITANGSCIKVTDTTSESNDDDEILARAGTDQLLTPPSSSSSIGDDDYQAHDQEHNQQTQQEQVKETISSRGRNGASYTNGLATDAAAATAAQSTNNSERLASEKSSRLKCTGTLNERRNVTCCSCCCHLHSSSMNNANNDCDELNTGAYAHFSITSRSPATASDYVNYDNIIKKLHEIHFDVVLGADGRRATLSDYFPRKEFRGRLAIAITANFVNTHTLEEARIPEISGISFIYNQQLFKSLYDDKGIDLENICYYKDDTHYFVMTAKKSSLLERKVLYTDHNDTRALLAPENINRSQLLAYAKDAAKWTTGLEQPLAINHYGEPDVAMFDFTSMYAAENACRAKKINSKITQCDCSCSSKAGVGRNNHSLLLVGLVGDSLLEPFWPTGSGCARGFLSAMDSAWMVRQWALKQCATSFNEEDVLSVLQEREAIYRLLGQTKSDNLNQNYASYTLNPLTRYPNLNSSKLLAHQCRHLLFDDVATPAANDLRSSMKQTLAAKRLRRATIASSTPITASILNGDSYSNHCLMSESIGEEVTLQSSSCQSNGSSTLKDDCSSSGGPVKKGNQSSVLKREFLNNRLSKQSADSPTLNKSPGEMSRKRQLTACDTEANSAFERSLADFEKSYIRGIKNSENCPSGSNSNLTQISSTSSMSRSGASLNKSSTFTDVILSPSANNLATMSKSRAKEIEAALRHRRQQASVFNRSESNSNSSLASSKNPADDLNNQSDSKLMQERKNKFSWLLENQKSLDIGNDCPKSDSSSLSKSKGVPFASRVKNLDAKLNAASGIHFLDPNYEARESTIDRRKIASKGSNVMAAASNLQQLLNPSFQNDKLKEKAADYRKKNSDIKVVMKMTDETDWNKKKWSQRELQAREGSKAKAPCSLAPRPKELIDLFIGKKHEIEEKLTDTSKQEEIKLMNSTRRQRSRRADDNEWIAILKGELNERNAQCKEKVRQQASVRAPYKSPFADTDEHRMASNGKSKSFRFESREREFKMGKPKDIADIFTENRYSSSFRSSPCIRCQNQVALVDKVVISGHVIHRSCLTCSKCGVTLRLSEVRNSNFVDDVDLSHFNYLCILCSKNKVNSFSNLATRSSSSHVITGKPPLDCITIPDTDGKCKSRPRSPVSSLHDRLQQEKNHQQSIASFAATDEYELKLKERMRWKEQFLMNNNNDFDLGSLIHRQIVKNKDYSDHKSTDDFKSLSNDLNGVPRVADATDSSGGSQATSDSSETASADQAASCNNKINERIEYENTSRELYDDDELTKLLNLESDQWQSGEEEEEEPSTSSSTSETDQRSDDSTEADFDSDEAFDASTASKLKSQPLSPEADEIPEIVVQGTPESTLEEEIGTATGDEIDTAGELDVSKNTSPPHAADLTRHLEEQNSSSDSDTLAGETTDSILVEDEEKACLLSPGGMSHKSSSSQDDQARSLSSGHTESEIWSESRGHRNINEPKRLAQLAEIESIGGSFEALPLIDNAGSDILSPAREVSANEAINGSPVFTKSYTSSPSTFESKSSCNSIPSPSFLRSISEATRSSASTVSGSSNVRSIINSNSHVTSLTETINGESDTLIASPGIEYSRYNGSDVTSSSSSDKHVHDDKLNNSTSQLSSTNHSESTGNNTSRQVDSSLLFASNSLFSPYTSYSHRTTPVSSCVSTGSTNNRPTNSESRVLNATYTVNNSTNHVKCSSFSPCPSNCCSYTPSLGFRVAQPKITKFNLDDYKLPCSNGSGDISKDVASNDDSVNSIDRNQTNQTSSVVSSMDDFSQVTTDQSPVCSGESYSRIPVLSKRTLPAYRGSFTDKLLERCRSTPSLDDSPDARKLSLASPPVTITADAVPASKAENSVLAKWACSNLLQMSTHQVGATPKLPFLSSSEWKSNESSPLSHISLPRHSSSYFMSSSHAFDGNDSPSVTKSDRQYTSHSLINHDSSLSPFSISQSESKEREQQQSTVELILKNRTNGTASLTKQSQPFDSSASCVNEQSKAGKSIHNYSPIATKTAEKKSTQLTASQFECVSSFSPLASSSVQNRHTTSPLAPAEEMPLKASATNTCSASSTNRYSRVHL